jgi:hypothetical protein
MPMIHPALPRGEILLAGTWWPVVWLSLGDDPMLAHGNAEEEQPTPRAFLDALHRTWAEAASVIVRQGALEMDVYVREIARHFSPLAPMADWTFRLTERPVKL